MLRNNRPRWRVREEGEGREEWEGKRRKLRLGTGSATLGDGCRELPWRVHGQLSRSAVKTPVITLPSFPLRPASSPPPSSPSGPDCWIAARRFSFFEPGSILAYWRDSVPAFLPREFSYSKATRSRPQIARDARARLRASFLFFARWNNERGPMAVLSTARRSVASLRHYDRLNLSRLQRDAFAVTTTCPRLRLVGVC